jgi:hypothetical protein
VASGSIKLTGGEAVALFQELRIVDALALSHGVDWRFAGGLALYLADKPADSDRPFELRFEPLGGESRRVVGAVDPSRVLHLRDPGPGGLRV